MAYLKTINMVSVIVLITIAISSVSARKLDVYRKPEQVDLLTQIQDLLSFESDVIDKEKLADANPIKIVLQNVNDGAFTGKLSIGGNKQQLNFIFDTGSPWLWVPVASWTSCRPGATKYTPDETTFKESSKVGNASYVAGQYVTGKVATEEIRITSDDEPTKMKIIAVDEEHEMQDLTVADGILGLAPSASKSTDLFVEQLYKQAIIPNKMFGLSIKQQQEESAIIFGGYDEEIVQKEEDIKWLDLYNKDSWWTEFRRINYGGDYVTSKGGLVVFDSGTSITTMSNSTFYSLLFGLYEKGETWEVKEFQGIDLWHCTCGSPADFKKIGISMNGWEAFLDPLIIFKDAGNGEWAIEILTADFAGNNDIILLGDNFLFNYYVVHDSENTRIGLVGDLLENDDGAYSTTVTSTLFFFFLGFLILNY